MLIFVINPYHHCYLIFVIIVCRTTNSIIIKTTDSDKVIINFNPGFILASTSRQLELVLAHYPPLFTCLCLLQLFL